MSKFIYLISFIFLVGCTSIGPANNAGFDSIETLKDLEGVYNNLSEGSPKFNGFYLSRIIWPNDYKLDCKIVETIEVRTLNDSSLKIKAFGKNKLMKEEILIEGKDFNLSGGTITLSSSMSVAGFKSGEPLLGTHSESVTLGVDTDGNGKYRESTSVVGLAYMFLPIAISENKDVRFKKIKE